MPWDKEQEREYARELKPYETSLTDMEWRVTKPSLPKPSRQGRPIKTDMRLVVDAIQYMLGTGCQWRQFPKDFPPITTVQYHFYKWRDLGIIEKMLDI